MNALRGALHRTARRGTCAPTSGSSDPRREPSCSSCSSLAADLRAPTLRAFRRASPLVVTPSRAARASSVVSPWGSASPTSGSAQESPKHASVRPSGAQQGFCAVSRRGGASDRANDAPAGRRFLGRNGVGVIRTAELRRTVRSPHAARRASARSGRWGVRRMLPYAAAPGAPTPISAPRSNREGWFLSTAIVLPGTVLVGARIPRGAVCSNAAVLGEDTAASVFLRTALGVARTIDHALARIPRRTP